MISRLLRPLLWAPRSYYSTQEKKNVVIIPKRWEVTHNQFSELQSAIKISQNCKTLGVLIKDNLELFTDHHISSLFRHIGKYDLVIDDHFHTVISPIAVQWVKTFTRGHAPTLGSILLVLTFRNISSPELEQVVVKKLDEENIYRYLDLEETAALYVTLSKHQRFVNHSLFNKIQKVIYEQKKYYNQFPHLVAAIKEGMTAVQQNAGQKPLQLQQAYKQIV